MYFPGWVDNLLTKKILGVTYETIFFFSDAAVKILCTEILQRDFYNTVIINSLFNFFLTVKLS